METRGFCWIDIETTGLDKKLDRILEVACIFTDFKLQHLSSIHVMFHFDATFRMEPFVENMHRETGLWEKLTNPETELRTLTEGDNLLTDWIVNLKDVYGLKDIIVAGSGVGQFDCQFIGRDFPMFAGELSYRCFDTRTLHLLSDMCGSLIVDEKPFKPEHVAMNDVQNSLAYARLYFNPFVETSAAASHLSKTL